MNKQLSIYLDLMRFLAAMAVLLSHIDFPQFINLVKFRSFGHDAVIVFFVLSGYVIFYVSDTKEKNIKDYFISRFARLYSVLFPALILSLVVDNIGHSINQDLYKFPPFFENNWLLYRFLANLFFINQLWFLNTQFLANAPIWSLGYEFWYYVLFGFAFFVKNRAIKILLLAGTCLLIGPKILILLPIWLMGTLTYYLHRKINLSHSISLILYLTSFILMAIFIYTYQYKMHTVAFLPSIYSYSKTYLADYLFGLFFGLNIFSFKYVNFDRILRWEKLIRNMASNTFSIYLYHLPLIMFYAALLKTKTNDIFSLSLVFLFTLTTIYFLALFTEKKKYIFKAYITKLFQIFTRFWAK